MINVDMGRKECRNEKKIKDKKRLEEVMKGANERRTHTRFCNDSVNVR
jgi:hypothetical protein